MKRMYAIAALVLSLGILAAAAPSTAQAPSTDVYVRMQKVNANLQSYTAAVHLDVETHGFPYVSPQLDGTAYFKKPHKNAVVFKTVPALASQFKKILPQMEPPAEWPLLYDVTPVSDDGASSAFRLVRKKNGRIDHVDVTVDDKTATVTGMTYVYKDSGGSVSLTQTYDLIAGNYVVKSQAGKIDIPHYNADVSSTFSNYKINVNVPDTIFAQ